MSEDEGEPKRPRNQPDLAFVGNMGGHPGDELEESILSTSSPCFLYQ